MEYRWVNPLHNGCLYLELVLSPVVDAQLEPSSSTIIVNDMSTTSHEEETHSS